jgi:paraquat-inducible protein A
VIVVLPLTFSIALNLLMLDIRSQRVSLRSRKLLKLVEAFRFWNMAEIYFLGVLVSIIKVMSLADINFGPSFWFFALFSVTQIATLLHMDSYQMTRIMNTLNKQEVVAVAHRKPDSLQRATAFLITGVLLYIPANIMPIMTVTTLGSPEPNTIVGGVISLWEHGSYPIAMVIFVASVLVPLGKFLILIGLLLSERFHIFSQPDVKMAAYRATESVGRWSMVDVFVVAFLAGLVQFGNLIAISPGPAVWAFAGMVVVTMLAAASLEPKMFWDNHEPH